MSGTGNTRASAAIAVIGVATRFPQADSPAAFRGNLRAGTDSVRPIPRERIESTALDPGQNYPELGYLDRIDLFDHAFFGLSRREAELIDPQHRLALQLTQEVLENAGFPPARLRDSNTAVVFSSPSNGYLPLVREPGTLSMLGNIPCALPTRISHLFGFTGPSYGVDTGCNGSLVAVHQACRELADGEADHAVVGGVSLRHIVAPAATLAGFPGIQSPTARSRAFDSRADGAGNGEGGGALLLTTLERAEAEGAFVHAVIRGTAMAHNGRHAATISTPSARSQAQVITKAWQRAGLDIKTAGYVETHGSGTRLGDAVEAEGLALARPGERRELRVGSVKTNLGHLDHAAGIAGLIKTILSVRHGELYPSLHFERAADEVDLEGARLEVVTELRPWPAGIRRAGVSSFSLGGVNAHCVIEQAPAEPPTPEAPSPGPTDRAVAVSARSAADLYALCERLSVELRDSSASLKDVARTLNEGRTHHPHRAAVVARDTDDLAVRLAAAAVWRRGKDGPAPVGGGRLPRLVLLLSADAEAPPSRRATDPALPSRLPMPSDAAATALAQLTAHHRLTAAGIRADAMMTSGIARYTVRELRGTLQDADTEALRGAASGRDPEVAGKPLDVQALRAAADAQLRSGPVVFLELSRRGELSDRLREYAEGRDGVRVLTLGSGPDGELAALAQLYELGFQPDWSALRGADGARLVPLPGHPFTGVPCWAHPLDEPLSFDGLLGLVAGTDSGRSERSGSERPDTPEPPPAAAPPAPAPPPAPEPVTAPQPVAAPDRTHEPVQSWLGRTLADLLHADEVTPEADYFSIGGNSVIAMQLIERVHEQYGVRLKMIDIYDHPRVGSLADSIDDRLPEPTAPAPAPAPARVREAPAPEAADRTLPPITTGGELMLSYGQERMWFHHQLDPTTTLYNLPAASRHRGPLDVDTLRLAWEDLAQRHSTLRSNFVEVDGRPKLVLRPQLGDFLTYEDVSADPDPEAAARDLVKSATGYVFDVAEDSLVRATVVRVAEEEYIFGWCMHHAVNDGWAPQIQMKELLEYYLARTEGRSPDLPPLPVQYSDYARWQRELMAGNGLDHELDYWRDKLADPPALTLPTDRPRPARMDFAGAAHGFVIPADLTRRLRELGSEETSTLFMVLLTGLSTVLARWSGQQDIVVGTPTIGRSRPELWGLLGFFNNTVALRSDLAGRPSFRELLRQVRSTVLGALDHQEIPFDTVVREVAPDRDPGRNPVFDVMYVHQTLPPDFAFGENLFGPQSDEETGPYFPGLPPGTAKFDLSIVVGERANDDELDVVLEYATQLFDTGTVAALCDDLVGLLRAVVADGAGPDRPCLELPAGPPAQARPGRPDEQAIAPHPVHTGGSPADLAYWREELTGLDAFVLPADRARPVGGDGATGRHTFPLPAPLAHTLARPGGHGVRHGVTAAIAALLARRAESDEVVLGWTGAGGIGLPLRLGLREERDFAGLVARVARTAEAAERHSTPTADELADAAGLCAEPGRHPLFDIVCTHLRVPAGTRADDLPGPAGPADGSTPDLRWTVLEGPVPDEVLLRVDHREDLFDAATVRLLAEELISVLRAGLDDPTAPLPALRHAAALAG